MYITKCDCKRNSAYGTVITKPCWRHLHAVDRRGNGKIEKYLNFEMISYLQALTAEYQSNKNECILTVYVILLSTVELKGSTGKKLEDLAKNSQTIRTKQEKLLAGE